MMNPERHSRIDAIKHEQMRREHGFEYPNMPVPPHNFENQADKAAQREAYNSKEGYC